MNWNNIDLNSPFERSQDILDGYDSETLLLEVACNLPVITKETIRKQAMESINSKYRTAIEILDANLENYFAVALKEKATA
jgi:hypothetical protein